MNNLSKRAMLVKVVISQWSGKRHDPKASRQVEEMNDTKGPSGSYSKELVHGSQELKKLKRVAQYARNYHTDWTTPWFDGGYRLLPASEFLNYRQKMQHFKADYEEAAYELAEAFPQIKEDARNRLGFLYNEDDYPTQEELRRKFCIDFTILPVPDVSDIRLQLDADDDEDVKKRVSSELEEAQSQAMKDLWERVYNSLNEVHIRLSDPQYSIRSPLFEKTIEIADRVRRLNVFDDQTLNSFAKEMEGILSNYNVETLRNDENLRQDTSKKLSDVMNKMGGVWPTS